MSETKTKKRKPPKLPVHMDSGCAWRDKRKRCAAPFTNQDQLCEEHTGKWCACGEAATHPCRPKDLECDKFACDVCIACCEEHGKPVLDEHEGPTREADTTSIPGMLSENDHLRLRFAVRVYYDLQAHRIAANHRGQMRKGEEEGMVTIDLDESDRRFMRKLGSGLQTLEDWAIKEVERVGQHHPMWDWLIAHKGIGPTLAGFLLSELNPHKAERPSSFWKFCGLHVRDGQNPRPVRGEPTEFNKRVQAKVLAVLGSCLLKATNETYYPIYVATKRAREQQIGTCMNCDGVGVRLHPKKKLETAEQAEVRIRRNERLQGIADRYAAGEKLTKAEQNAICWVCKGKKVAPWGRGPRHRHNDANRQMVKRFIADFWIAWRLKCGLPVVPPYELRDAVDIPHAHRARYGIVGGGGASGIEGGEPYTGPAFPDEDGNWPGDAGWPREIFPDPEKTGRKIDRFGRPLKKRPKDDADFGAGLEVA